MRVFVRNLLFTVGIVTVMTANALAQPATGRTDVYGVLFMKAAPGQAEALGKALMVPPPNAPMADHFVLLRHQEGDDWDYCLIRHLGPKTAIEAAPANRPHMRLIVPLLPAPIRADSAARARSTGGIRSPRTAGPPRRAPRPAIASARTAP